MEQTIHDVALFTYFVGMKRLLNNCSALPVTQGVSDRPSLCSNCLLLSKESCGTTVEAVSVTTIANNGGRSIVLPTRSGVYDNENRVTSPKV